MLKRNTTLTELRMASESRPPHTSRAASNDQQTVSNIDGKEDVDVLGEALEANTTLVVLKLDCRHRTAHPSPRVAHTTTAPNSQHDWRQHPGAAQGARREHNPHRPGHQQ